MLRIACTIIFSFAIASMGRAAFADGPRALSLMRKLDAPAPSCDQAAGIDVSDDYFVPIGNDLPGMPDYNRLVKASQDIGNTEFDSQLKQFQTQFESSPLQEAASYLNVNHLFRKAGESEGGASRDAEKALRETMLLYPKSTLKPVVLLTASSFLLSKGQYTKALSLLESLKDEFPVHPLACVISLGIGEARYFSGDKESAKVAYTQCLQKCRNRRVTVAAQLRLSEMGATVESLPGQKFSFDSLYRTDGELISRFFPGALYDYAEKLYSVPKYDSSKYFFEEYLKHEKKDSQCNTYARKRLADIALRKSTPLDAVKALYLDAYEHGPQSDAGLSSKMIALLLDLPRSSEPEQQRKVLWIDEQIDSINDERLKSIIYLEKGLVLLELGHEEALGYLIRLNEKTDFDLRKGEIASFVREHLLKILKSKGESIEQDAKKEGDEKISRARETEILSEIEGAIAIWLKTSSFEKNGIGLYRQLMISLIESAGNRNDLKHLVELLVRWESSGFIDKKTFTETQKGKILNSLSKIMSRSSAPAVLATQYLNDKAVIDGILGGLSSPLWLAVAVEAGDEKIAQQLVSTPGRLPAALPSQITGGVREYLNFTRAMALMDKKTAAGEALFRTVKDKKLQKRANSFRFDFYRRRKNFGEAFGVGKELFSESTPDEQKNLVTQLLETANVGKLWGRADDLMNLAKSTKLSDHELVPYHLFSGVSLYEKRDFRKAIGELETAISLDQKFEGNAEARFKLGQSLFKTKRVQEARRVWEDLIRQRDPHWSPLAQNELALLKK